MSWLIRLHCSLQMFLTDSISPGIFLKKEVPPFFCVAPIGHGALFGFQSFFRFERRKSLSFRQNDHFFSRIHKAKVLFGDFIDIGSGGVVFVILEFFEIFLSERRVFFFKVLDVDIDLVIFVDRDREVVEHVGH